MDKTHEPLPFPECEKFEKTSFFSTDTDDNGRIQGYAAKIDELQWYARRLIQDFSS